MTHCRTLSGAASALVSLLLSSHALAATITSGNVPQPGDENVLFNGAGLTGSGTTVQGRTNQGRFTVDFTSTSWLQTPAKGQASIDAGTETFTNLSISLHDPHATFASLIFNLDALSDGPADVTAFDADGGVLLHQAITLGMHGNNFLTIVAGPSQYFSRILISGSVELTSARQFRLGGLGLLAPATPASTEVNPDMAAAAATVPAPSAAWGGAGLLALYSAHASRTRRARLAAATIT